MGGKQVVCEFCGCRPATEQVPNGIYIKHLCVKCLSVKKVKRRAGRRIRR